MIGLTIGRYRLTHQIGAGGMGAVYAALHETIGQEVAVKILHPRCAAVPLLVQRFFNEARAAARVRHPGVVKVFDFGTLPEGAVFMIMERLSGEPLRSRLHQALPAAAALRIARQVASLLAALHRHDIIHRDLKPDNLFLSPDPEVPGGERVRLLDFGIARLHGDDAAGGDAQAITATGAILGTPQYMAPEQCRGGDPVDDRADVYSLGVLLYQMLAGQPPFTAAAPGDLMAQHLLTAPPPLPAVAQVEGVAALLDRMLAKTPQARPSAEEVMAELSRLGADPSYESADDSATDGMQPVKSIARPVAVTLPERSAPAPRRSRRRDAVVAVMMVLAATLLASVLGRRAPAPREPQAVASEPLTVPPPAPPATPVLPPAPDASLCRPPPIPPRSTPAPPVYRRRRSPVRNLATEAVPDEFM